MPGETDAAGSEATAPIQGRLVTLWAVTVAALAVHNAEEWLLNMTGWIADHPWLPGRSLHGDQTQFALALVIVTAAVLLVAVVAVTSRAQWSAEVLVCVAYALMINAVSHLLVSVMSWSLMPGAITGALILLPLGLITVQSLPPVRWTASAVATTVAAALITVLGSLALAALLAPN